MSRVTSLTNMSEEQLNRWIKRIALLFVVVLIAFVAFYAVDRFRAPAPTMAERDVAVLEEALRKNPNDIPSRGRLGDVYVAAGRYDEAIAQYDQILKSGKEARAAHMGRARALELKGELDAAAADYNEVVKLSTTGEMANVDAGLASAYYGLGSIAMQQDKPKDAIDMLLKALAIKRTDADAMALLGSAYVKAGTPDKAVEPLRRAITFVPVGWAEPYQTLAAAYNASGDTDLAEWADAMAAAQTGDSAGAVKRLQALTGGKAALDALIGLGQLNEAGGNPTAAADWYRKAIGIDAKSQAAQLGLSRVSGGTQGHPSLEPSPSAAGSN
jgi:tetratricopeptide (TPR) repeat protein